MAIKVGEVVSAHCSQCKENLDMEVAAVVGDEIVTVTCRTCGTTQHYKPPLEGKARTVSRRVVDMDSTVERRPRARNPRRVVSSTGREIIDESLRSPMPRDLAAQAVTAATVRSSTTTTTSTSAKSGQQDDTLFQRWTALTEGLWARHGRPHRSHESYRVGEVVLHTVHGMGIVEKVAKDGELTVLFMRGYQQLPSRVAE